MRNNLRVHTFVFGRQVLCARLLAVVLIEVFSVRPEFVGGAKMLWVMRTILFLRLIWVRFGSARVRRLILERGMRRFAL